MPLKLIEPDATGINEVKSEATSTSFGGKNKGAAYDLQGRNLPTEALHQRGSRQGVHIFIQNGKKFSSM